MSDGFSDYATVRLIEAVKTDQGTLMPPGSEGVVVDADWGPVAVIEFEFRDDRLVGGKRFETAAVNWNQVRVVD